MRATISTIGPGRLFAAVVTACGLTAGTVPGQTWDAARMFSPGANPGGTWSYGYAAGVVNFVQPSLSPGYALQVYTVHGVETNPAVAGMQWWRRPNAPVQGTPSVSYNPSASTLVAGSASFPARGITFHPDNAAATANSIIRWTVPATGNYRMRARFRPTDTTPSGVELYIVWNAQGFLMGRRVLFAGQVAGYTNDIALTTGDTVDCVVGPRGHFGFDTTTAEIQFERTARGTLPAILALDRDKSCLRTGPNLRPDGMPQCSGAGSSPVFSKAGNYRLRADDAVLPARGMPLQITRFYNAVDDYAGPFSHNWTFNYTIQLMRVADAGGGETAIVRWANGVRKYFTLTNGAYQASAGCYDTLATNAAGFRLRTKGGLQLDFSPAGFLSSQADANSNRVSFTYNAQSRLSRAASDDGRFVDYAYGSNGCVSNITDWSGRQWQYQYDTSNNLARVVYPDGSDVAYAYDACHALTAVTDARGNTVGDVTYVAGDTGRAAAYRDGGEISYALTYSAGGQTTATDSRGHSSTYGFNAFGNKTNWVNTLGHRIGFDWTPDQAVATVTDPLGRRRSFAYDARGNVLGMTNAMGLAWQYAYEPNFNRRTSVRDPAGQSVTSSFDARGNLLSTTDARGFTMRFGYDAFGQVTNATDPRGNRTDFSYDAHGNLTSVRDALGGTVRHRYDDRGNRTAATDARGHTWTYGYDAAGRMVAVTNPLGQVARMAYDAGGNLVEATDLLNRKTRYAFDAFNRLVAITDALGYTTRYEYDAYGQLAAVRDALGHAVSNRYDAAGRRVGVTDPLGAETLAAYDANGNRTAQTDAAGRVTRFAYDALDRVVAVTNAGGGVWRCAYDPNGNPVATVDANSHTNRNAYDARNALTNAANALGLAYRYQYDANNNLVARTDPNGDTLRFSYDALNRMTNIAFPDGTRLTTRYDANGNVVLISNATEAVEYVYDALNRVTNVLARGLNRRVAYAYDAAGNRTAMTDPAGGRTGYTYDALNRVTSIRDPSNHVWSFSYDAVNRPTNAVLPNGVAATYEYDAANRLTGLVYRAAGGATLQSFAYAYDAVGNPLRIRREDALYELYAYDNLDRLTRADYDSPDASGPSTNWIGFAYDPAGNRTAHSTAEGVVTYTYDAADRLLTVTSALNTVSLSWDGNGNVTQKVANGQVTRYRWNAENQLVGITYPSGQSNSMAYYPDGLRHTLSGTGGVVRTVYDGQNPLQELSGAGALRSQYVNALGVDVLLARQAGAATQYYLRDALGSVSGWTDGAGALAASYRYGAFGAVRSATGAGGNPRLFTGRTLDADSGLYYYRARYLDANLGRFLSTDPDSSGHAYAYVGNRPTVLSDPAGRLGVPAIPFFNNVPRYASNMEAARAQGIRVYSSTEEALRGVSPGLMPTKVFCGTVFMSAPPPAARTASARAGASVSLYPPPAPPRPGQWAGTRIRRSGSSGVFGTGVGAGGSKAVVGLGSGVGTGGGDAAEGGEGDGTGSSDWGVTGIHQDPVAAINAKIKSQWSVSGKVETWEGIDTPTYKSSNTLRSSLIGKGEVKPPNLLSVVVQFGGDDDPNIAVSGIGSMSGALVTTAIQSAFGTRPWAWLNLPRVFVEGMFDFGD